MHHFSFRLWAALACFLLFIQSPVKAATDPASCQIVRFSNPGWTDINVTTTLASILLNGLGYKPQDKFLSVPITFASMESNDIDVFLGLWSPSMDPLITPYLKTKSLEIINTNLPDARYGLAVPRYTYDAGLKSLKDIKKFSNQLHGRIYGVEPGNDGNQIILSLIKNNNYGLGQMQLIESSEQAMMAQVDAMINQHSPIVFLAWQPHPMNLKYNLVYLDGNAQFFGNQTKVSTVVRKGYLQECPNIGRLLSQLTFNSDIENSLMQQIIDTRQNPTAVVTAWLKKNPQIIKTWLQGVTTINGQDGLKAVQNQLSKI